VGHELRPADGARALLSAAAVRDSANRMMSLACRDALEDWHIDLGRLPATADLVAKVVRDRYPRLDPPVHARWRHFVFGGHDLWHDLVKSRAWPDPRLKARAAFDLVLTSVLLDAGAGSDWRYRDAATGLTAARSEGLALASLRWFEAGGLSDDPRDPWRVDVAALRRVDAAAIGAAFQVRQDNPLLGAAGRASLLNRLGDALQARLDLFGLADTPRPGGLFDALARRAGDQALPASVILSTLLDGLGSIWENRPILSGVPLGDCWPHPAFKGETPAQGYVPLHKLSQWLTYSLLEPLEEAGVAVCGTEELTGLAEYRNGGLFVDTGVLTPRGSDARSQTYSVSDPFVVGWRALTVALLDRAAPLIRDRLGLGAAAFPLSRVLEGGTWAAGRLIARDKRADGGPPFRILSDGTVF
jgi:Protein of unknown function (DUF1688)